MYLILYYGLIVIGCIPVLYRIPKVQYYTRFTVFCGVILLGSFYYAIRLAFHGRSYQNAWRYIKIMSFSGRLIGLHPVIENSEMLSEEPCIYVCNHQSCIDVASAAGVWPKRCTVVSKASLRLAGPMGIVMWLSNTICINRSSHKDAISAMQKASAAAKRDHVSVFIFPEGTRSDNDNLLPFKKGAFHMAIQCQFPIQPIVIEPYKRFLDHKNKVFEGDIS
uniref:1-acyl-sn-glycerol-3-phosphate acyltransferase n=1 Tax=Trichobilharzia regenti TaxID=157069 RepID=A0AA85JZ90_TRIRE|nr:unnamed protein product [Trichobilharzia regenti]